MKLAIRNCFIIDVHQLMRNFQYVIYVSLFFYLSSCNGSDKEHSFTQTDTTPTSNTIDTTKEIIAVHQTAPEPLAFTSQIDTRNVHPAELISFAQTLVGIPYKYASTDPAAGFDCSGFITYVFNHFNIAIPRSSIDFTSVGKVVDEHEAEPGDIILFTGTNPAEKSVGHMGLIIQNKPEIQFIHSSSGKANGVTITRFNDYYRSRFVKIIRIFKENN